MQVTSSISNGLEGSEWRYELVACCCLFIDDSEPDVQPDSVTTAPIVKSRLTEQAISGKPLG